MTGKKWHWIIALFLLITFSANFVFPATTPTGPPKGIVFFAIGLMIAVGFLVILFMINHVIQNPHFEAWIKTEMWQVVTTVVLGLFIILLFRGADSIALVATNGTSSSLANATIEKIDQKYDEYALGYQSMAHAYFVLSRYVGFSYSRTQTIPIIGEWWSTFETGANGAGVSPLLAQMSHGFDKHAQTLTILAAEKVLIKFSSFAVYLYLLPLGLVFRALPFTRSFGSTLIAISVALYFLFPMSLLVFFGLQDAVTHNNPGLSPNALRGSIESQAGSLDPGSIPGAAAIANPIASIIAALGDTGFTIVVCVPICLLLLLVYVPWSACWATCKVITELVYIVIVPLFQWLYGNLLARHADVTYAIAMNMYSMVVDTILPYVTFTWVVTIIGFIAALIITISSIRGLGAAIGGELQLYGISRVL